MVTARGGDAARAPSPPAPGPVPGPGPGPAKTLLGKINSHLICVLCAGYYIDATTIVECLHTFCRSCIVKHLRTKGYCPVCEVMINTARPNIKLDKALQDIVYKLVPGLFQREMARRRAFYASRPHLAADATPEQRGEDTERIVFSPDDVISFSLEYADGDGDALSSRSSESGSDVAPADDASRRYLRCPAVVNVSHLKKFLTLKFDVDPDKFFVEILYKRVPLPDYYTLMDVAYIYNWKRIEPMRFYYQISDRSAVRDRFRPSGPVRPLADPSEDSSGDRTPSPDGAESEDGSGADTAGGRSGDAPPDVEKSQFLNSFELTAKLGPERTSPGPPQKDVRPPDARPAAPVERERIRQAPEAGSGPDRKKIKPELPKPKTERTAQTVPSRNPLADESPSKKSSAMPPPQNGRPERPAQRPPGTTRSVPEMTKISTPHRPQPVRSEPLPPPAIKSAPLKRKLHVTDSSPVEKMSRPAMKNASVGTNRPQMLYRNDPKSAALMPAPSTDRVERKPGPTGPGPAERKPVLTSPAGERKPSLPAPGERKPSLTSPTGERKPNLTSPASGERKPNLPSPNQSERKMTLSTPGSAERRPNPTTPSPSERKPNPTPKIPSGQQLIKRVLAPTKPTAGDQQMKKPPENRTDKVERTDRDPQRSTQIKPKRSEGEGSLKSLFNSCNINIPPSLSITIKDQDDQRHGNQSAESIESKKQNQSSSGPGANQATQQNTSQSSSAPGDKNYLEIIKLPESDGPKMAETQTAPAAKPTNVKPTEVLKHAAKGPVPNLKPISEAKNAPFSKPQTFQQTFLQSLQQQRDRGKVNKSRLVLPKLTRAEDIKEGNASTAPTAGQNPQVQNVPLLPQIQRVGTLPKPTKPDSALDLSTPHPIQSQLGPQQAKALETMQSIANLAKRQQCYNQRPAGSQTFSQDSFKQNQTVNSPIRVPVPAVSNSLLKVNNPSFTTNAAGTPKQFPDYYQSFKQSSSATSTVVRPPNETNPNQTPKSQPQQTPSTYTPSSDRSQTRSPSSSPKLVIACPSPKSQSPEQKQFVSPKSQENTNAAAAGSSGVGNSQSNLISSSQITSSNPNNSEASGSKDNTPKVIKNTKPPPPLANKIGNVRGPNNSSNNSIKPNTSNNDLLISPQLLAQQAYIRQQLELQTHLGLLPSGAANQWFNNPIARAHFENIVKNMAQSAQTFNNNHNNKDK